MISDGSVQDAVPIRNSIPTLIHASQANHSASRPCASRVGVRVRPNEAGHSGIAGDPESREESRVSRLTPAMSRNWLSTNHRQYNASIVERRSSGLHPWPVISHAAAEAPCNSFVSRFGLRRYPQKVTPHTSVWFGRRIDHFHDEKRLVIAELNSMEPPEIILLHEVRFGRRQETLVTQYFDCRV